MPQVVNADPLVPGRKVGKYEVVRRLASGGMAEIYLARAVGIEGFRKHVVLKRMLPQYAQRPEFVKLFLNEARLAATLDHPNIATIFDIGEVEGIYFLAMEYLHGEDMSVIAWELDQRKDRMPLEQALTVCVGAAAGLHHAHEKRGPDGEPLGIVHRDVSPSNIVVTYQGGVKLVDFGIAKVTAHAGQTATNTVKGKLAYMSPEQCEGRPLDRRSDVWALGVVLYEITTQSRLFLGESDVETVKAVMRGEVDPPSTRVPGYPADLEAIVMKALQKRVEDRFATARDLQLCIEEYARNHGLLLSYAALGEWLEATMGTREEPWDIEAPADAEVAPGTAQSTRVMSDGDIERAMSKAEDDLPSAPPSSQNPTAVMPRLDATGGAPRRPWALYLTGVGATLAGASALAVTFLRAPPPTTARPVVVVSNNQVDVEGEVLRPPPPPAQRAAEVPDESPTAAAKAADKPPTRPTPPRRARAATEPRADGFSVTFARREREIEACFKASPDEAEHAGQLAVRFATGVDGRVTSAEVLPPELARTKLGSCVVEVARTTVFAPQPEPVAFRIPVKVRRTGGPGDSRSTD